MATLPLMMFYGQKLCTCFDVYKMYMDLPMFIHKRDHPGPSRAVKSAREAGWR